MRRGGMAFLHDVAAPAALQLQWRWRWQLHEVAALDDGLSESERVRGREEIKAARVATKD